MTFLAQILSNTQTTILIHNWLKCRRLKLSGKQAHLILPVHDLSRANTMYLNRVQIRENALKENNLNRIHLKDLTVPEMPKSGSKVFPSQDVPSLFNDGLVYHYMLESPPVVEENINNTEDEENPQDTGLGHMIDKPFTVGTESILIPNLSQFV